MTCEFIPFCTLEPSAQAAWAQALGSIGAILVAVAVPACQGYRRRRIRAIEEARRARSLAIAHLPVLRSWHEAISTAEGRLAKAHPPSHAQWGQVARALHISLAEEVAKESHHFGDASDPLQGFLYHCGMARIAAVHLLKPPPHHTDEAYADYEPAAVKHREAFDCHFRLARDALARAIALMERIAAKGAPNPYLRR